MVITDLEPICRHEQGGRRRTLVVSRDSFLPSGRATVCPITAARSERRYPREVLIPRGEAGQTLDGVILVHQVRTISLDRVKGHIGVLTSPTIRLQVREALTIHFGLDVPEDEDIGVTA
ncbi:MAG: type II toxin-antitoxin system PemK/MazF family toxin [Chloroflexota bacterium]